MRIVGRELPLVDRLPPFHIHSDRFRGRNIRFHFQLAQHEAHCVAAELLVQEAQVLQVRFNIEKIKLILCPGHDVKLFWCMNR